MSKSTTLEISPNRKLSAGDFFTRDGELVSHIRLSEAAKASVKKCHRYLVRKLSGNSKAIYGINTGFGDLSEKKINKDQLSQLQTNLIRSHACGAGNEVAPEIVRLMLALKIRPLAQGHSGVHPATLDRIVAFYNEGIVPVVYEQGSLGASGDLAPLAHLFLPLIGEGEVHYRGERLSGAELHKRLRWKPLTLGPKEGLALLNGTQFMLAHAVYLLHKAKRLLRKANEITALSLIAYDGRADAFHPLVHKVRPHPGQTEAAKAIYRLIGPEHESKKQVQDPYAFRCVPQVHGASADSFRHAQSVIETEINSVSDNPLIFPDEDRIISGGNFHGQPLALVLDGMCLALSELGSISERRGFQLLSGANRQKVFLARNPGLESGLMIVQYTAASIASLNKQLCTPSSADSITSSNGKEDHVSMGANAAVKCLQVARNVSVILGIELICASQGLSFRRNPKLAPAASRILRSFREAVPVLKTDRVMSPLIGNARAFVWG